MVWLRESLLILFSLNLQNLAGSLLAEGVAEHVVDHLEDVVLPALLDVLYMDVAAEAVVRRNVGEGDIDFAWVIKRDEIDDTVCVLFPLLKLPFHADFLVFYDFLVDALDRAVEHLQLATYLDLWHG